MAATGHQKNAQRYLCHQRSITRTSSQDEPAAHRISLRNKKASAVAGVLNF